MSDTQHEAAIEAAAKGWFEAGRARNIADGLREADALTWDDYLRNEEDEQTDFGVTHDALVADVRAAIAAYEAARSGDEPERLAAIEACDSVRELIVKFAKVGDKEAGEWLDRHLNTIRSALDRAARSGADRPTQAQHDDLQRAYEDALSRANRAEARSGEAEGELRENWEKLNASLHEGRIELTQGYHGGEDERVEHVASWLEEHESLLTQLFAFRAPRSSEPRQDQPTAQAHTNGDCLPGCAYCAAEQPETGEREARIDRLDKLAVTVAAKRVLQSARNWHASGPEAEAERALALDGLATALGAESKYGWHVLVEPLQDGGERERHEVRQGADSTGYGYRATCTCGWTATGASLDSVETAGDAHRADLPDADTATAEYEETKRRVIAGKASIQETQDFIDFLECAIPNGPPVRPSPVGARGDGRCRSTFEGKRCGRDAGHAKSHTYFYVQGGETNWQDQHLDARQEGELETE